MQLNQLVELEASSLTRPNRIDWFFKFKENSPDLLNELNSDLRINVSIAGDEVINTWREVFIPEGWKRADEEKIKIYSFGVFDYNLFNFANNLCYFDRFIFMEQKEIKY